jgi:hypothetical protein
MRRSSGWSRSKDAWGAAAKAIEATEGMADEEKNRVARIKKLRSVKHSKIEGVR